MLSDETVNSCDIIISNLHRYIRKFYNHVKNDMLKQNKINTLLVLHEYRFQNFKNKKFNFILLISILLRAESLQLINLRISCNTFRIKFKYVVFSIFVIVHKNLKQFKFFYLDMLSSHIAVLTLLQLSNKILNLFH